MDNKIRLIEANLTKKALKLLCEDERASMTAITYFALMDLIDKMPTIEVESVKSAKWISVKDRLPERGTEVLVTDGLHTMVTWCEDTIDGVKWVDNYYTYVNVRFREVTHWMFLPTPPESEDDAENSCMKEASEGEWIVHFDDLFPEESTQECSICHAEQYLRYGDDDNYCPNCGTKMKQEI